MRKVGEQLEVLLMFVLLLPAVDKHNLSSLRDLPQTPSDGYRHSGDG